MKWHVTPATPTQPKVIREWQMLDFHDYTPIAMPDELSFVSGMQSFVC